MKIQVWSDFVCPFCYIGKKHLEAAIKESGRDVTVEMMSFELDPTAKPEKGLKMHEVIAKKYGVSEAEAKANNARIATMAKAVGLNYDFDAMIPVNTFKAHKVFQLAKAEGVGDVFNDIAMSGFFETGRNLSDDQTLVAMGVEAGLNAEAIAQAIASDEYGLKVRQDQQWAQTIGAKGVPHTVFDDKVSLSGAQPIETFKQAMAYVETLEPKIEAKSDAMCVDGVCEVK